MAEWSAQVEGGYQRDGERCFRLYTNVARSERELKLKQAVRSAVPFPKFRIGGSLWTT
jgi:hypothetical protein